MPVQEVRGDLLEPGNWDAIAHQINSRCIRPHGLSAAVASLGRGCHYSKRRSEHGRNLAIESDRPTLGSIDVLGDADDHTRTKPYVIIGLVAQRDYGSPHVRRRHRPPGSDTILDRLRWFRAALDTACQHCVDHGLTTLALPYKIGCGLGGGDWDEYCSVIDAMQRNYEEDLEIVIVRRPQD